MAHSQTGNSSDMRSLTSSRFLPGVEQADIMVSRVPLCSSKSRFRQFLHSKQCGVKTTSRPLSMRRKFTSNNRVVLIAVSERGQVCYGEGFSED